MAVKNPPPDFVIRFHDVVIDRSELEKALASELDRYERSRDGLSNYAQMSLSGGASEWQKVTQFLDAAGPRVKALVDRRLVGSACIDFAVPVKEDSWAQFFSVPAPVAERAGRNSIEIEVSIYRTNDTR
jgi:hypothetical protein